MKLLNSALKTFFGPPNIEKMKKKGQTTKLVAALSYRKDPAIRRAAAKALDSLTFDWRFPNPLLGTSLSYVVRFGHLEEAKLLKTAFKKALDETDIDVKKTASDMVGWLDRILPECSVCGGYLEPTGNIMDEIKQGGGAFISLGGSFGGLGVTSSWDNWLGTVCGTCALVFCSKCRYPGPGNCPECGDKLSPAAGMYLPRQSQKRR